MPEKELLRSAFKVGSLAAFLAAGSVVVANAAFAALGPPAEGIEQTVNQINTSRSILIVAFAAVGIISLLDIFTVPGLYLALREAQPTYALLGSILAVVGDILGLASGVIQSALLRLSTSYAAASGEERATHLLVAEAIEGLEGVFSTSGFLLVGASFVFFGLAMLQGGFSRWIGWIAIAAGILSILGQVPSLLILFLAANILYIAWYIGIGARFRRLAV